MSDLDQRLAGLSPQKRELLRRRLAERAAPTAGPQAESNPAPVRPSFDAIAIIGAACRLPGGVRTPDEFWRLLVEGRDAVTEVPAGRWDASAIFDEDPLEARKTNSRWGGFLDRLDEFDAAFFGISPREAASMDPQQRLLLELSWQALESAGQAVDRLAGSATGVFVGAHSLSSDYLLMQLGQREGIESHFSTGSAHSILANRISYLLDLQGPSMAVDTACSSSLVALHLACQSLRSGESDLALAAGVNLMLLPPASLAFTKLQILSSAGRCRTFDAAADGIARGEGCVVLVLKRLADAQRDGDPILARIRSSAVNQDGASNGLTAPSGSSQEALVRRALQLAGLQAERVGLIETHGTGTALGDPVEVEALSKVFGARPADHPRCFLGAVKTNLGHLEGAAGIAGLLKAVLCLQHRRVPANLHFKQLNPHIRLAGTPFEIPTEMRPWDTRGEPRVAGVSSFGFGGTNAHVLLEEDLAAAARAQAAGENAPWLLPLSARSRPALVELARAYQVRLQELSADALPDFVAAAATRRAHHAHRVAVVADDVEALAQQLEARLADLDNWPSPRDGRAGGAVFVFSGQGGQWDRMGRELFESEPVFRAAVLEVASAYRRHVDRDLVALLTDSQPEAVLMATDTAQPALFALQLGLAALWRSWGVHPAAVIGHSVGEVAAAHVAGVLSLEDAVAVIHHRSAPMQALAGLGRMAQVELPEDRLRVELQPWSDVLSIAALNGPASTVVAGEPDALHAAMQKLESRGIVARALPSAFAFHSYQMEQVAAQVGANLAEVRPRPARLPLVSTVSGGWSAPGHGGGAYWARNVREAVRFAPGIAELLQAGFGHFVEIGPHPALGAGIAAVASELEDAESDPCVVASLRRGQPACAALLASVAHLYEAGAAVDWHARSDPSRSVPQLPHYPFQRRAHWLAPIDPAALAFNVTGRPMAAPAAEPSIETYAVEWEQAPGAAAPGGTEISIEAIRGAAANAVAGLPESTELAAEPMILERTEHRAAVLALQALQRLGLDLHDGARIDDSVRDAAGVVGRHARLWERLLDILAEEGMLRRADSGWLCSGRAAAALPGAAEQAVAAARIESVLMERCGAALPDVLTGHADPLALLFPDDEPVSAAALYASSPSARLYNRVLREALRHALPLFGTARPLRVLEIGAGTGGTTAAVIDLFPAGTDYCFTDVSPLFLHDARARFGGSGLAWSFRRLDIEHSPQSQGFAAGCADLVLASNVLHAIADLRQTLRHVRSLLAPGGVLMLLETVGQRRWADLTFGMTEGWWRFADPALRSRHALLASDQWIRLLGDQGFDEVRQVGAELSVASLHPQAVLLARAGFDAPVAKLAGTGWLVLLDQGGRGAAVADRIESAGGRCLRVPAVALIDPHGAHQRIVESQAAFGADWRGIVHCGGLDADAGAQMTLAQLDAGIDAVLVPALHAAQALAAASAQRTGTTSAAQPRLWLITRAAQQVAETERQFCTAQAPLWGFGRSLALESPQIWGGLIDLDARSDRSADADAVVGELCEALSVTGTGEDQVAWRSGCRYLARLARAPAPPAGGGLSLGGEGAYLVTGGYGGLGPKVASWLAAHGARYIVLLGRQGLPGRSDWPGLAEDDPRREAVRVIERLESVGVVVRAERGDVADVATMTGLLDSLRHSGTPLRGVVHAAASIGFRMLDQLSAPVLRETVRAKVRGGWLLHELTRDQPLDLFVLFSSGTGVFGAKGLAAYAASNQFLTSLASQRAALGLPVTCVDWGAWSEIRLMGRDRQDVVGRLGLRAMQDHEALSMLADLVVAGVPQRLVANVDWPVMTQAYESYGARPLLRRMADGADGGTPAPMRDGETVAASDEVAGIDLRTALTGLSRRAAQDRVAAIVRRELANVLRLGKADVIDEATGFFDLGLDSLMAVQLRRRLSACTGVKLPATATFNYPNVGALTAYLLDRLQPPGTEALPAGTESGTAAARADEDALASLADSEVEALLVAELRDLGGES